MSTPEIFKDFVWYVSYGSNMNYDRFMKYINVCDDKSEPKNTKAVILPFNMYFSGHSITWDSPVCFLDTANRGEAYGVAYLIKHGQLDTIVREEGSKYSKVDISGTTSELSDYPVFTLKASKDEYSYANRKPYECIDKKYLSTIAMGLKTNFNLTDDQIEAYLRKCGE